MKKYYSFRGLSSDVDVNIQLNDVYGVGMIVLSMMTLGSALEDITATL